jgi:alanine-glyoxylate transaminase / serine-glyoxylate transaminase / serine-pyruvate transaminase
MTDKKSIQRGWHFLQIPGPSNTPERILRAMNQPTMDHRGPEFGEITTDILTKTKQLFQTSGEVIIYPSSGTGAWEAALTNLFNPGDKILAFETGYFALLWKNLAEKIGLEVIWLKSDWRHGVDPNQIETALKNDVEKAIKGVMVIHNETCNGITSDLKSIRQAIDNANHPALFLADVVSSLGTTAFNQDEMGIDVAICASQKGLMMPPGLGFNSINEKALNYSKNSKFAQSYWKWDRIVEMNKTGYYPYTPASGLFFGLNEALDMIIEEGLENVVSRHQILSEACRVAADTWGLENQCLNADEYSDSTTALIIPEGHNADELRKTIYNELNMSLGTGLGQLKSKVFRIGHLGDMNELMLMGTLSGVEMGMTMTDVPFKKGGAQAALEFLAQNNKAKIS